MSFDDEHHISFSTSFLTYTFSAFDRECIKSLRTL